MVKFGCAPFCTKCYKKPDYDKHELLGCLAKWPPWGEQLCDRCGTDKHETIKCSKQALNMVCKNCGHEGHHRSTECPIKDPNIEENLNQYTKAKYEAVMAQRNIAAAKNAQKSTSKLGSSASQSKNVPSRAKATSSGPSYGGPSHSSSAHRVHAGPAGSAKPNKPIIASAPGRRLSSLSTPKTPEQKENEEWATHNLELADFASVQLTAEEKKTVKKITTNFFKVSFDKVVDIRKYRIVLGQVDRRDIKKRETKRAMINDILTGEPPTAKVWLTDYCSHIISVGKLYNYFGDTIGEAVSVKHERPLPGGQTFTSVDSTIFYEGVLNVKKVKTFIDPKVPRDPQYYPEEDFRILNLISWTQIYDPSNSIGIPVFSIGKKFYPDNNENSAGTLLNKKMGDQNRTAICVVKRGFFTSMRPGTGSLLLNVNPTTTAFFPAMNLHVWITRRSTGTTLAIEKTWKELKDLRVTFEGDAIFKPRVIHRIGLKVTDQTFLFEGARRTVLRHMQLGP